jgi:pimeloyl-ACP methyl ester carboxylesterase
MHLALYKARKDGEERRKKMKRIHFKKFFIASTAACCFFCMSENTKAQRFIDGAHSVTVEQFNGKNGNWLTTKNPDQLQKAGGLSGATLWGVKEDETGFYRYYSPKEVKGKEIRGAFGDARFVIRVPRDWNGKLVVSAPGGNASEMSNDLLFSDYVLEKGYAYASTDKGTFGGDNALVSKDDSLAEWHMRFRQLTKAAQSYLSEHYKSKLIAPQAEGAGKLVSLKHPIPTYAVGYSNGGYVVRYALEHDNEKNPLFDGGVDMAGVLWRANEPNLITSYTQIVQHAGDALYGKGKKKEKAIEGMYEAGLPRGTENYWFYSDQHKWFNTLNRYRDELDPTAKKTIPWQQYTNYDQFGLRNRSNDYIFNGYHFDKRPDYVKRTVREIENTGEIKAPLITVFGTWDAVLFPDVHAYPYEKLVKNNGSGDYRLYMIEKGAHSDALVRSEYDIQKDRQPLAPYVHQSFDLVVEWVENGQKPPRSKKIATPQNKLKVESIQNGKEIEPY